MLDLKKSLKQDGFGIVGVRGDKDIEQQKKDSWVEYGDGYITPKQTFQKGFSTDELVELFKQYFRNVKVLRRSGTSPLLLFKN